MGYRIEFDPRAEKELAKLDREVARRIVRFLRERVALLDDPRSLGEALHGPELGRFWKYRVGDYRLICHIQDQRITVLVLRIGHRRDVYR
ncbi:type II toxin-antitoxin system RelE family toxin [Meiothermus taiwanensis]|uniref:Toxin RelG n=2 Tax=Meiothermus taiwanensis TaxID=172827 RepID=A0A399DRA8_9DEIN|nr:type II toxin-antitoxin system RelE/ParE family toxin [Meiothermus taiwanensis]AWR87707.1 addiction module toxin, RelE/StbE family [Meiothermus taiwanensis WR-220]KIQ54643.1 translation repressor RelE [Meiothermus taiwanensis]KZK15233.1 addiction module toxin RelE [Meiothermus taiwanensis]RIH74517.1 Toxin RelG [Meiothermus taiwanensis]